jgi:hypothetical protein
MRYSKSSLLRRTGFFRKNDQVDEILAEKKGLSDPEERKGSF